MITNNLNDVKNVLIENGVKLYSFNFRVSYDCDLSSIYFEDFKSDIEDHSLWMGDRQTDYLVIFENEKVISKPYYTKTYLRNLTKQELYDLAVYYELIYDNGNQDIFTKAELIESLYCIRVEDYYKKHYEESSYHELDYDFSICGYSQGDAVKIKLVGNVEKYINAEFLTNIFYDTPLQGEIIISLNGEEIDEINFNEIEGFEMYSYYDKDDLLKLISDHCINEEYHALLIDYLESNMPNDAVYSY